MIVCAQSREDVQIEKREESQGSRIWLRLYRLCFSDKDGSPGKEGKVHVESLDLFEQKRRDGEAIRV